MHVLQGLFGLLLCFFLLSFGLEFCFWAIALSFFGFSDG
jgi:hypothetical protein